MNVIEWFMVILDVNNHFPLSQEEKLEMGHFAILAVEHVWLYRNHAIHGKDIPTIP